MYVVEDIHHFNMSHYHFAVTYSMYSIDEHVSSLIYKCTHESYTVSRAFTCWWKCNDHKLTHPCYIVLGNRTRIVGFCRTRQTPWFSVSVLPLLHHIVNSHGLNTDKIRHLEAITNILILFFCREIKINTNTIPDHPVVSDITIATNRTVPSLTSSRQRERAHAPPRKGVTKRNGVMGSVDMREWHIPWSRGPPRGDFCGGSGGSGSTIAVIFFVFVALAFVPAAGGSRVESEHNVLFI